MDSEKGWTLLFWAMIIIGVLAVLFRGAGIEQDLTDRANAALHGNGLQWASVKDVKGRNLVLSGESPVKAHRDWARNTVKDLYGVHSVDDEDIGVKSPVSPYTWAAIVTTDRVTLTGFVPDEDTRAAILGKVGNIISDRAVTDKMVLADGAPDVGWLENINNVLKYTKYLKNGAVHLNDRSVKVEGEAWNSLDFEVIALRSSRGRTVNEYAFSSDLISPENTAGQSLITSAPSSDDGREDDKTGEPEITEKPAKTTDAAPAAAAPDSPVENSTPVEKTVDVTTPDAKADKAEAPSPEPAKATDTAAEPKAEREAVQNSPAASGSAKSDKSDASTAKAETSDAPVTMESKPKLAEEKKPPQPVADAQWKNKPGQSAASAVIPPHMMAPPWAWAPYQAPPAGYYRAPPPAYYPAYRAPPGYDPNCAYANPYAPAYCGRPGY